MNSKPVVRISGLQMTGISLNVFEIFIVSVLDSVFKKWSQ